MKRKQKMTGIEKLLVGLGFFGVGTGMVGMGVAGYRDLTSPYDKSSPIAMEYRMVRDSQGLSPTLNQALKSRLEELEQDPYIIGMNEYDTRYLELEKPVAGIFGVGILAFIASTLAMPKKQEPLEGFSEKVE